MLLTTAWYSFFFAIWKLGIVDLTVEHADNVNPIDDVEYDKGEEKHKNAVLFNFLDDLVAKLLTFCYDLLFVLTVLIIVVLRAL